MDEVKLKISDQVKHFGNTPEVKSKYSEDQKFKIAKASKDFESLLTSMMLKSMNQTTEGIFGEESYGGDFFNGLFETEMASHISENRGIGIAEMLYRKITGEEFGQNLKLKLSPVNNNSIKNNLHKISLSSSTLKPANTSLRRLDRYENIISDASEKFGIDKNLIKSVILTESAAKENALSKANAKGLMQLIDSTANDMGVNNVWDPKENIFGGAKYLAQMLRQYDGDTELALAGYNAGPGNVDKYNGVPPFEETKNYISRVLGYYKHFNGI